MLIKTNKIELEIAMPTLFIKAFNYECHILLSETSSWRYFKESKTERELQIGKVKIIISG